MRRVPELPPKSLMARAVGYPRWDGQLCECVCVCVCVRQYLYACESIFMFICSKYTFTRLPVVGGGVVDVVCTGVVVLVVGSGVVLVGGGGVVDVVWTGVVVLVVGSAVVVCVVVTGEVTATAVQFTAPTPSVKVPSGQARHTSASAS